MWRCRGWGANYLAAVMDAVSKFNRYFAAEEPWALKGKPRTHGHGVICHRRIGKQAAILLQPVIPAGASQLLDLLEIDADKRDFAAWGNVIGLGISLPAPQGVFPRLAIMEETADS